MRLFLTGGTGFIGSNFIEASLLNGHEVVALKRPQSSPAISLSKQPDWVIGDLETYPESTFQGCNTLVHLASFGVDPKDSSNWEQCFRWNVSASFKLWKTAIQAGVKRLIICGSCYEYGSTGGQLEYISVDTPLRPQTAYAASKAAASMLAIGIAASHHVDMIIVRPFHVYGEGEAQYRLWPSLKEAAISGNDFPMTEGQQVRDFTPVDEIVQNILDLLAAEITEGRCQIKNWGTGKPKKLLQFCEEWWAHWKATGKLRVGEIPYRSNEVMRFVPAVNRNIEATRHP